MHADDDASDVDSHDHDDKSEGKLLVCDGTMAAVASLPMGDALASKLQCHQRQFSPVYHSMVYHCTVDIN